MKLSGQPLLSEDVIARRVHELAEAVSADHSEGPLLVLAVLKGGIHIASDLVRRLTVPVRLDFIRAKSYRGTHSGGSVELLVKPTAPIRDRHVLVVEDILDTGRTAAAIVDWIEAQGPAGLKICTLVDKPSRRLTDIRADYTGFEIEDHFVVGYGMDYEEQYRELPAIYVLERE